MQNERFWELNSDFNYLNVYKVVLLSHLIFKGSLTSDAIGDIIN